MSEYRCSQCKATYSFAEYTTLKTASRVTDDPDDEYGVERVCECGAKFHSDKWQTVTELTAGGEDFRVSTVALTIPHGLNHDQWYETCVFHDYGSRVTDRYETEEEAETGHDRRVTSIEEGTVHFEPAGKQLVLDDE